MHSPPAELTFQHSDLMPQGKNFPSPAAAINTATPLTRPDEIFGKGRLGMVFLGCPYVLFVMEVAT